ncbi:MAG: hypothetical protein JNK46_06505, partial [Methylobacteriaceae bacterium]|nr:hypothetical protein [Methylobacteriaceae bacterium]
MPTCRCAIIAGFVILGLPAAALAQTAPAAEPSPTAGQPAPAASRPAPPTGGPTPPAAVAPAPPPPVAAGVDPRLSAVARHPADCANWRYAPSMPAPT